MTPEIIEIMMTSLVNAGVKPKKMSISLSSKDYRAFLRNSGIPKAMQSTIVYSLKYETSNGTVEIRDCFLDDIHY